MFVPSLRESQTVWIEAECPAPGHPSLSSPEPSQNAAHRVSSGLGAWRQDTGFTPEVQAVGRTGGKRTTHTGIYPLSPGGERSIFSVPRWPDTSINATPLKKSLLTRRIRAVRACGHCHFLSPHGPRGGKVGCFFAREEEGK